jgi:hypothetical protein
LIGAIAAGETLETAELHDAFISLNQRWSNEASQRQQHGMPARRCG